jgi:hypothetical protein
MALSDSYANKVLDAALSTAHVSTWPATVYVALSTTTPTNTGTNVTEPSGAAAYARVAVANDDAHWPAAAARAKSNGAAISFPLPTGSWGTITYFALYDAATAGNFLGFGALVTPTAIASGQATSFGIGAIVLTLT